MTKFESIIMISALLGSSVLYSCNKKVSEEAQNLTTDSLWLIVGSYASAEDTGIKAFRFDTATGEARYVDGLKGISNPSYLTLNSEGNMIYSVGEDAGVTSTVNAIAFDSQTGAMNIKDVTSTKGGAPCYITLSPDEAWVLTANYMGANISIVPLDSVGGFASGAHTIDYSGQGTLAERQSQPHLHCVKFTPDGQCLLANDLGLDAIHTFKVNPNATPADSSSLLLPDSDIKIENASGPRHIEFDNNGKFGYLINEISGQVTVLENSPEGLRPIQYIAADTVGAQGSGDIHLSSDGKFLYASNRLKADGIAIFSIDENTGQLTRIGYQLTGKHPRNFILTPDDRFLLVASRDDDVIEVYSRNAETGLLTDTGYRIQTSKPVCLKWA